MTFFGVSYVKTKKSQIGSLPPLRFKIIYYSIFKKSVISYGAKSATKKS